MTVELWWLALAVALTAAAAVWSLRTWRRRRDRTAHATILRSMGISATAAFALTAVGGAFNAIAAIEIGLVLLVIATPIAGMTTAGIVEIRQGRERRALRQAAAAIGADPAAYRRQPRHPMIVFGLYFLGALLVLPCFISVMILLNVPARGWWLVDPVTLPGLGVPLPAYMIAPMLWIGCGIVHAFVNDLRRTPAQNVRLVTRSGPSRAV